MQKVGAMRAINPYHPFWGMWVAVTRSARGLADPTHIDNAVTIQEALRAYTLDNAFLLFQEDSTGSIEVGKWADLVIIDRDLYTCPNEAIRDVRVLETFLAGKSIFRSR